MINHILLICSSVIIYEFIKLINFRNIIKSNLKIYKKIFKLFKYKNVSDSHKEKLIFNYSKLLLVFSVKIIITFISIFTFLVVLNFLSFSYLNLIFSVMGILEQSIIFLIYHFIRKHFYA